MAKAKKDMIAYFDKNIYRLKWVGGGEVSGALSGGYTSAHEALAARAAFIDNINGRANAKR